jgi:autotransporter-associated beta strand protein
MKLHNSINNRFGSQAAISKVVCLAVIANFVFFASSTFAATVFYWNGNDYGGDYWTYSGNWTGGTPSSTSSSDVEFQNQYHNWNSTDNYGGWNALGNIKIDSLSHAFTLYGSGGNGIDLYGDINNYNYNSSTIDGLNLSLHGGSGTRSINTWNGDLTLQNANIYAGDSGTTISFGGNSGKNIWVHDAIQNGSGPTIGNVYVDGPTVHFFNSSNSYGGSTTINTGALTLEADNSMPSSTDVTINSGGTLNVNQKAVTVATISGGGTLSLGSSGGTLTYGGGSSDKTFSGSITGGQAITKQGSTTWTLSGASASYTGATTVSQGKLVVSGAISSSAVSVSVGATLAGGANTTSSVGAVSISSNGSGGGTLAPGDTTGTGKLTVNGDLNLGSGGTTTGKAQLKMELNGTTAGTGYDQISVNGGAVNLNNVDLSLTLSIGVTNATLNSNGTFATLGTTFYLVIGSNASIGSNHFANDLAANFSGGYRTISVGNQLFAINYAATNGSDFNTIGGGHDIALMAIPEPGTWMMLLGGFGMFALLRRSIRFTR